MAKIEDDILEQYLAGKSDISKQYQKSEQPDVPKRIDDVVLSLAKFSVAANESQNSDLTLLQKWQVPLSIAAVFVISASLVFTLFNEYGQSYLDSPAPVPVPQSTRVENANAPMSSISEENALEQEDIAEDSIEYYDESTLYINNDTVQEPELDQFQQAPLEAEPIQQQNTANQAVGAKKKSPEVKSRKQPAVEEELENNQNDIPSDKSDITTFVLSDSLNTDLLNKEKVKVLSNEIEELKRAKAELAKEQELLKQTLEKNTSKHSEIQQKILDTSDLAVEEQETSAGLNKIINFWNQGDKTQAEILLKEYIKDNSITLEQLSIYLPDELVQAVSQEKNE